MISWSNSLSQHGSLAGAENVSEKLAADQHGDTAKAMDSTIIDQGRFTFLKFEDLDPGDDNPVIAGIHVLQILPTSLAGRAKIFPPLDLSLQVQFAPERFFQGVSEEVLTWVTFTLHHNTCKGQQGRPRDCSTWSYCNSICTCITQRKGEWPASSHDGHVVAQATFCHIMPGASAKQCAVASCFWPSAFGRHLAALACCMPVMSYGCKKKADRYQQMSKWIRCWQ